MSDAVFAVLLFTVHTVQEYGDEQATACVSQKLKPTCQGCGSEQALCGGVLICLPVRVSCFISKGLL
jgi:hypothetical protein